MSSMPRHADVLYLIAQYLQVKGLFASSLALQQESGLDVNWLRGSSHELALLRRWIFDGDVERARALLQPVKNLSDVPGELEVALFALDELEMTMKTAQIRVADISQVRSQFAAAKLKCFERMVPLFRDPVGADESNVFKYVAMSKLQLVALIHDAVLFHRQTGDGSARDCVSVTSTVTEEDTANESHEESDLLLLDEPHAFVPVVPAEIESVGRSMDWAKWRRRQQNPMGLSVNLNEGRWQEGGVIDGQVNRCTIPEVKETTDAAVSCELDVKETTNTAVSCELDAKETADSAVSCELDVKSTADAAVSCKPEEKTTADIAVSCGTSGWSDTTTQTEIFRHFEERASQCAMVIEIEENQRDDSNSNNVVHEEDTGEVQSSVSVDNSVGASGERVESNDIDPPEMLAASDVTASWAQKSSKGFMKDSLPTPEVYREIKQPEQKVMLIEDSPTPEEDDSEDMQQETGDEMEFDVDMSLLRGPPQHYNELQLDDVVCASVIAEVKEPQAVRALDVHPSGTQLAVGTNARALRVFDLSTPLQQRQQQVSWSSPLITILPLLPVTLERHKHHDSGIYCVSYNRHLPYQAGASMISSGAADGSVKVFITREKDPLQRQQIDEISIQRGDISGSMGKTRALEFASPHLLWVTSTNDRRLCCWDVRRTRSSCGPFQTLDGHVGEIQEITMPDPSTSGSSSTLLLSAALDKTVRLWDTRSRRCERLVTSGAHPAFSLHFHPTDDELVVSGHQDGSVALWDLRSTAREALQVVAPHQDECRSVRWSPGGQWLLSAAFDGTLCIMQTTNSTLQPVASYHKHNGKVLQAQWHPTQPAFVSSGADKRVKLWAFA